MTDVPSHRSILVSGPLCDGAGPRVAVKDVFDVAGAVTTACSRALATARPAVADADVVIQLKAAGCSLIGRANMHELAFGVTGINGWTGTPINPSWPDLIPGGSSSGSAAAVASGIAEIAIGSDTGGSIRMPAACCSVVGLKPTYGRVSRVGVLPGRSTLDCVGPFARNVAMIERAMKIICPGWRDGAHVAASGALRIGWIETAGDNNIQSAARAAAAKLGELVEVRLPGLAQAMLAGLTLIGYENWQAFGALLDGGRVGNDVSQRLRAAASISPAEVQAAENFRQAFIAQVDQVLAQFDVLALPTLPQRVPTLGEALDPATIVPLTANVRPFNLSGHPAISLPVAEVNGRPVSLQLIGRRGEDEALCALAREVDLYIPEMCNDHLTAA